jgi:hypothetical protein
MRIQTIFTLLILTLASATPALAYNWGNNNYGSTMYGYGSGYSVFGGSGGRVIKGYSPVDGYRLTEHGPYAYPPSARFVSDTQFRGHYDAWSGRYYDAWNGRTVSQYPRSSGGVPAVNLNKNPYVIDRYY